MSGLVFALNSSCLELVVWSSREKFQLLTSIAATYPAPRVDRRCVTVKVIERASGTAERALEQDWSDENGPRPHVWSPAATTWLLLLRQHRPDLVPAVAQPIIQSPLVIAMPEPMFTALHGSIKNIGWHDVHTLARDPQSWARFGKSWGRFRLGKTTPLISTSGLHAMISLNNASQAEDDPVAFLQGVESSVAHYADSVGSFLANLRQADDAGQALEYVSAIAVEEKQVFDYNRGNTNSDYCATPCNWTEPKTKLVSVYPREGTLIADHPYAVLNWNWVDDAHRQAASDFRSHLESPPVQSLFQREGFRDHQHQAGALLQLPYFDPDEPRILYSPPTPAALNEIRGAWSANIRKRSNALIVLDVGPSMDFPSRNAKLAAVKNAVIEHLKLLADDDEVGLWTFPTADGRPYHEVMPITKRGPPPHEFASHLDKVVTVAAGRALFATVRAAVDRVQAGFVEGRVNAVIVVSDGRSGVSDDLPGLLKALRDQHDDQRVLILTVALSEGVSGDLDKIATESLGLSYEAFDVARISEAIRNALANL